MGILFRVVLLLVAALVVLVLAVVMASESGEVVVLRTSEPGGPGLETRLWVIDDGYQLWLRAGDPGSGWFERLKKNPQVELSRDRETSTYVATPVDDPERRDWINFQMAEKYGWADWMVGLMRDSSGVVPVRLDPA